MWDKFKEFIFERLNEASTGRALTILAGLIGWKLSPENASTIAEFVVMALVLFGVLPDKKKSEAEKALEAKALEEKQIADASNFLVSKGKVVS